MPYSNPVGLYSSLETAAEQARIKRRALALTRPVEADESQWEPWLRRLFHKSVSDKLTSAPIPFASHQAAFWDWVWALQRGVRPKPFVGVWPRGGGKSESAELATVAIAALRKRVYCLYICETQDQADDHVANIAEKLESQAFGLVYPQVADRAVGKYGSSRGWRRNRLHTRSGFVVDALGLDSAARGAKVDEERPDLMVIDDVDGELDSPGITQKKIQTLTRKLLPAGTHDLAVIAIQNMVHPDSIFARLVDGRADFLADREVSGPVPALEDVAFEQRNGQWRIIAGRPTWQGQSLARCRDLMETIGYSAFKSECQHDCQAPPGGMYDHIAFQHCTWNELPDLVRIVCWTDPAVTDKDESDSNGIQIDGLGRDGKIYRLWSFEERCSPLETLKTAIVMAIEYKAECVGVETDQGGETWDSVYNRAVEELLKAGTIKANPHMKALGHWMPAQGVIVPRFKADKAGGRGPKTHRQQQVLADYELGRVVHVLGATHALLERALQRFPKTKPLDLADAGYWSWQDLRGQVRSNAPVAGGHRPLLQQAQRAMR